MSIPKILRRCLKKLSKEEFKEFVCELLDREEHPKVYKKQVEGKDYIDVAEVMVSVFSEVYVLQVAVEVLKEANFNNYAIDLAAAIQELYESYSAATPQELYEPNSAAPAQNCVESYSAATAQNCVESYSAAPPPELYQPYSAATPQELYEPNPVETNTDERKDEYDEHEDEYDESGDEYDESEDEDGPSISAKEFVEKNKKKLMAKTTEANALLDVLHHNKVLDDHSYCKMKALSSDKKKMKKLLTGAYLASEAACDTFCDFLFSTQPHLVANLLNY